MDNPPLPEDKDASLVDPHHARFQRTDQWMPVYSWLESLDTDEVVKSKDILDWLLENPEIKEQLYSRHSRYHLMHYIKKCHVKILKRKEKKKGLQPGNKANYAQVHKTGATKLPVPVPFPANSLITKLPGFNATFPSKHYSGYVSIDGNPAKQLFFYFVKSERKPSNDPVVLWLNGVPGCSSFDGFVYEHATSTEFQRIGDASKGNCSSTSSSKF